jgi:hypothetical protein
MGGLLVADRSERRDRLPADAYRGVDVLRIDGGGVTGKKVKAPVPNGWFGSPSIDSASFIPHSQFGFMCTVLKPDLDTP